MSTWRRCGWSYPAVTDYLEPSGCRLRGPIVGSSLFILLRTCKHTVCRRLTKQARSVNEDLLALIVCCSLLNGHLLWTSHDARVAAIFYLPALQQQQPRRQCMAVVSIHLRVQCRDAAELSCWDRFNVQRLSVQIWWQRYSSPTCPVPLAKIHGCIYRSCNAGGNRGPKVPWNIFQRVTVAFCKCFTPYMFHITKRNTVACASNKTSRISNAKNIHIQCNKNIELSTGGTYSHTSCFLPEAKNEVTPVQRSGPSAAVARIDAQQIRYNQSLSLPLSNLETRRCVASKPGFNGYHFRSLHIENINFEARS